MSNNLDESVLVNHRWYYSPSERLMCNSCGRVSSSHLTGKKLFFWKHESWPKDFPPQLVCVHTCKSCGRSVDNDFNHSFTDKDNYECDKTRDIYKWEKELDELKEEIELLEHKINKGKARWAELWETNNDVGY